jgi:iron complex outermembrane receptor protein
MFTSDRYQMAFGANYKIKKFDLCLNNTYFGKTTFKQAGLEFKNGVYKKLSLMFRN